MSLDDSKRILREQIRLLRAIEYIIDGIEFRILYDNCPVGRGEIDNYIQSRDLVSIKNWLRSQKLQYLDTMTVAELRKIAQLHQIDDYPSLRRDSLIEEIRKCQKKK